MKRFTFLTALLLLSLFMYAQNPNFHIYLAFGQSNMEGNATPENQDKQNVPERFKMMAAVNFNNPERKKGQWYTAVPPLCRQGTGLTPCDYFGRTLCERLPEDISIGIINVALGGTSIKMFDEDMIGDYLPTCADWLKNYAAQYNNQPYKELIELAKKAQKQGVIKGILLHQGCTDNMQQWWPEEIKKIYNRMLSDLNLSPEEVPLLVGELVGQAEGGSCYGHNSACIAKLPSLIKHCYVISSSGCPQRGDGLHFTAEGYRTMGRRYAAAMLDFLEKNDVNAEFSATELETNKTEITLTPGLSKEITLYAKDIDGGSHNVTRRCSYMVDNPNIADVEGIKITAKAMSGSTTIHVSFTDKDGKVITTDIIVNIEMFPLTDDGLNPSIVGSGSFNSKSKSLQTDKNGFAGWQYSNGIDLTPYEYLIVRLRVATTSKPVIRIYDSNNVNGDYYKYEMKTSKEAVIPLKDLQGTTGTLIDLSDIHMIGISSDGSRAMFITEVFLSNDGKNPITAVNHIDNKDKTGNNSFTYDLMGRKISQPRKGMYIIDGKKIIIR